MMKKAFTLFLAMVMLACTGFAQADLSPRSPRGADTPMLQAADRLPDMNVKKQARNGAKISGNPTWGQTMSYCLDAPFSSSVGAGGNIYWGIKIEADALVGRNNITEVQFYVVYAGTYQLSIYSGMATGTPVFTQTVTATTAEEYTWKSIQFATPMPITQNQDLWVTFYNSGVSYPAAGVVGNDYDNGKYVSTDGSSWSLVSDYGLDYTWMIRVLSDTYTDVLPEVYIDGPDNVVMGDTAVFEAVSPNANTFTWTYTANYQQSYGSTAEAMWNTPGDKTLMVSATNSTGTTTATKTTTVHTPCYVTLSNADNGYFRVWSSTINAHRVPASETVHSYSGDVLWLQFCTFAPTSRYYGQYCNDNNARLSSLMIDGVNIPLDGSDPNLEIDEITDYDYIIYYYPVTFDSLTHSVSASFGSYYDGSVVVNTISATNTGGGYMSTYVNGGTGTRWYAGTTQLHGIAGDYVYFVTYSFPPTSQYYYLVPDSAAMLTAILVDGVSQPLDGTGIVNMSDYLFDRGYLYYTMQLTFDSSHTVEFVYGPYEVTTAPTVSIDGPTAVVPGTTVEFVAESNDPTATFAWTVDGVAQTANTNNTMVYTFNTIGNYTVGVTATNNYGSTTDYLTVSVAPPNTITVINYGGGHVAELNEYTMCPAGTTVFTAPASEVLGLESATFAPESYYYDQVPDSAAMLTAILVDGVSQALDGTGDVTVYDYLEGGGVIWYLLGVPYDSNHTVEFFFSPFEITTPPTVSIDGPSLVTPGTTATFTAVCNDPTATFAWTVDGTAVTGNGNTLDYTFTSAGYYTVGVTATNSYGSTSSYLTVSVEASHTITVINNGGGYLVVARNDDWNNYSMCYSGNTTFTGISGDYLTVEGYTFIPTSPFYNDLVPASATMLTAVYIDGVLQPLDGTGSVQMNSNTDYGYIWYDLSMYFDADHTVEFIYGPYSDDTILTVSINGPTTVIAGNQVTFTAVCNDPTATFAWTVDGNAVSGNGYTLDYTFTAPGYYTVGVTATNSDGNATATWTVSVENVHTITVINTGGGYLQTYYNQEYGIRQYEDTIQMMGTSDDYWHLASYTFSPTSQYYSLVPDSAAMLTAVYIDGVSQPLDGTGSVAVDNYLADNGYIFYGLTMYFNADHTVEFVFGPYVVTTAPTVSINGPATVIAGNQATFTAMCDDPAATFTWTVDGTAVTGNGNTLDYTFNTVGTHTVGVTATNSYGNTTATWTFSVIDCSGSGITTFPYTEDFEDVTTLGCWQFVDADGDGYTWDYDFARGGSYGHNGSDGMISSASYINSEGPLTPDNWMIMPAITLPATATDFILSWWEKGFDAGWADEYYSVYISTTGNTVADFSATNAVYTGISTDEWVNRIVNLGAYAGQTIYVAFRHYNVTDMYWLDIDDITVGPAASNTYIVTGLSNDAALGEVYGGGQYNAGETAMLVAVPYAGSQFNGWNNGNMANPLIITVNSDVTIYANFSIGGAVYTDTIYLFDSIYIFVDNYIHDTTVVNNYIHDTTVVENNIHDTTVVNNYIHDTTVVNNYIHDTAYITVYDTLWMVQYDTVWHYDTIIIHDTIIVGVDEVDAINVKVYSSYGQVVVEGAEGNAVWLYDVTGRVLATRRDEYMPLRFDVPASGTYMIKIGNHPAHKVVVIR